MTIHPNHENLSKQELRVLTMIGQGKTNAEMADQLYLSTHTIKNHKANIKEKLDFSSTTALLRYAVLWLDSPRSKEY